jgi:hypothetical protein
MERETKIIKTPSGKEVILKSYLTAGERDELMSIILNEMKFNAETNEPVIKEIPGHLYLPFKKKLLELLVVSYDGNSENILGRLSEILSEEYDFIVKEADKISRGNFSKAR